MPGNPTYTVASAQQYLGTRTSPTIVRDPESPTGITNGSSLFVPTPKNFSPTDQADSIESKQPIKKRASSDTLGSAELWYLNYQFRVLSSPSENDETEGEEEVSSREERRGSFPAGLGISEELILAPAVFDQKATPSFDARKHSVPIIASPVPSPRILGTITAGSNGRAASQGWNEPAHARDIPPTRIQPQVVVTEDLTSLPEPLVETPSSPPSSRRGRLAAHSPNSSAGSTGTEIYFSPISATKSQVFLSSPQPSPPLPVPSVEVSPATTRSVTPESTDATTPNSQEMAEIAGIGRAVERQRVQLTMQQLDQLTLALATAPLVTKHLRSTNIAPTTTTAVPVSNLGVLPTPPPSPPAPPLSFPTASCPNAIGGIALLDPSTPNVPLRFSSTPSLAIGASTCLRLPEGQTASSILRIEPSTHFLGESKIVLQILLTVLPRGSAPDLALREGKTELLLAEIDLTTSFQRAALTELATMQNLTLDEIEIATPTDSHRGHDSTLTHWPSTEELVDWCALGDSLAPKPRTSTRSLRLPHQDPANTTNRCNSYTRDVLTEALLRTRGLTAETCAMQTLTLLSELKRLGREHAAFLILQQTRWDEEGRAMGVKVPFISPALQKRLAKPVARRESSIAGVAGTPGTVPASATEIVDFAAKGSRARVFREAVVAAVSPFFRRREEFETVVRVEGGWMVGVRCVPLFGGWEEGSRLEKWVVFCGV